MPSPTLQTPAIPVLNVDILGNPVGGLDGTGTSTHAPTNTPSTALSGTIATSGTTTTVPFTATARQEVINPSTATIWASWGAPTVNGAGSFPIAPGGSFSTDRTAGTLTLLSTASAQTYTVNRYS